MGTAVDDEFREMELYLQQAQEEIVQVFDGQEKENLDPYPGKKVTQPDVETDGTQETHETVVHGEEIEQDLKDILCLYDNMEFYGTQSRNACQNEPVAVKDGTAVDHDEDEEEDLDEILDKYVDSRVPSSGSDEDDQVIPLDLKDSRSLKTRQSGESTLFHLDDAAVRKIVNSSEHEEYCERLEKCKSCCVQEPAKVKVVRSLSVGDVEDTKQRFLNLRNKLPVGNRQLDNVTPLNFQFHNGKIVWSNSSLAKRHSLKDPIHLSQPDEDLVDSLTEWGNHRDIQMSSCQIDDKQSERRLQCNDSFDKDKLDNLKGDSDGMRADSILSDVVWNDGCKCADNTSDGMFNTSKSDIAGDIQEVRKSIDGLITAERETSPVWSSKAIVNNEVLNSNSETNKENVSKFSRNDEVDRSDIGKQRDKMGNCVGTVPTNGCGNDVVETEHGYFWLTSTLSDASGPGEQTFSRNKSDNSSRIKLKQSSVGDSVETKRKSNSDVDPSDVVESKLNDAKSSEEALEILPLMTLSAPSFPALEPPSLNRRQVRRNSTQLKSDSDENLIQAAKRKYSAPSLYTVYKVISVDIPKMDSTGHYVDRQRYGDASKKCVSSDLVSSECGMEAVCGVEGKVELCDSEKSSVDISDGSLRNPDLESTVFEPPFVFKDQSLKEEESSVDITAGPIIEPPPAFASDPACMDDQQPNLPSMVWDPGVSPAASSQGKPSVPERKVIPKVTPPPPSADKTEQLISKALNPVNKHRYAERDQRGVRMQKQTKDSVVTDKSKLFDKHKRKHKPKCNVNNNDMKVDFNDIDNVSSKEKLDNTKCLAATKTNFRTVKGGVSSTQTQHSNMLLENGLVTTGMLDLLESYHPENQNAVLKSSSSAISCSKDLLPSEPQYASIDSSDSEDKDRKTINDKTEENMQSDESEQLYAKVVKKNTKSLVVKSRTSLKPIKVSVPKVPELAPPIPERAPSVPPKSSESTEAPPVPERKSYPEYDSRHEPSAEMQVMFNSLSPVLLRRRGSTRSNRSVGASGAGSVETSPESTPSASPRSAVQTSNNETETSKHNQSTQGPPGPAAESLFMDPEMARTWHGATSSNWSQLYGPQMRAMMKELNHLTNGSAESSQSSIDKSEDEFKLTSHTLPSKSLLDQMHKKFCADQYWNSKNSELARALVLLRLKTPPPPPRAKRSQSFNIRMGMGKSGSSLSSESSPLMPRMSERVRIKTKPGMKYLTKSEQTRAVTPEVLCVEEKLEDQSPKDEDAEIEAVEACRWLKETGFPQYAQLYEDGQFPVDIEAAEKDHDFLDKEDIQSLFRRLNTLNKCTIMKIGTPTKKEAEDSDEEDQCALSDKWKYQRSSRRWSRKDLDSSVTEDKNGQTVLKSASSHDSLLADDNSSSETGDSPILNSRMHHTNDDMVIHKMTSHLDANGNTTMGRSPKVIRRVASERIKGAKSFLKRVESLKSRGKARKPKTINDISGPVIKNNTDMQEKLKHLNCKEITSNSEGNREVQVPQTLDFPQPDVTGSSANTVRIPIAGNESTVVPSAEERVNMNSSTQITDLSSVQEDNVIDLSSVLSDTTNGALSLDLSPTSVQSMSTDTTTSSEDLPFLTLDASRPGRFPTLLDDSLFSCDANVSRTRRSFSHEAGNDGANDSKKSRRGSHDPKHHMHRVSIYDNVPVEEDLTMAQQELDIILSELFQNINGLNRAINGEDAELLEPPVSGLFDDSNISVDSHTPENEAVHTDAHSDTTHEPDEIISGTSSPDISDHELHTEDMSHDDSAEHIVCRERRDSGVGSSLTRTNSDRRKYRIRWHSFQKQHRPTSESRNLLIGSLSAGQIQMLRKLSLLKLTALIEKYSPNRSGWSLTVPRFMKRNKVPDYRDKNVFGVPFSVMIQRTGQALPQCILHALRFLRRTACDALGIFRKSGVRSRIQKLRNDLEANPELIDFDSLQAFDVADLVKQYFRELPECLLTNKLSDIFISIFIYVPVDQRLEALQAAVILMADENRDVLQSLLLFLSDIARHHNQHQMTASNLAVCFAPSLFNMGGARNVNLTPSPRRNRKNPGIPDARELMEQKAAHECLTVMIQECKKLFTIPAGTLSKCRVRHGDTVTLDQLNSPPGDATPGYTAYIDACIQGLLKESREKFRSWVSVPVHTTADVSYKKVGDGHPLRLWRCTVDVEAPPSEVLDKVLNDRQSWDEDLLQWNVVEKLDKETEVFHYVRNTMAPHPTRDFCVLRSWRTDLPKGACVLISTSIEHASAELQGDIRAVELASRYLIEPCGTGKSRLTHISRVDIRGHSPDWYKKVYGHLCANFIERIRLSFVKATTDGPETKV